MPTPAPSVLPGAGKLTSGRAGCAPARPPTTWRVRSRPCALLLPHCLVGKSGSEWDFHKRHDHRTGRRARHKEEHPENMRRKDAFPSHNDERSHENRGRRGIFQNCIVCSAVRGSPVGTGKGVSIDIEVGGRFSLPHEEARENQDWTAFSVACGSPKCLLSCRRSCDEQASIIPVPW